MKTTILTSPADYENATAICVINDIEGKPERKCMTEARIWHNETPAQAAQKLMHLSQTVARFDAVRADADAAQRGDILVVLGCRPNEAPQESDPHAMTDPLTPGLRQIIEWARTYVDGETCIGEVPRDKLSPEERAGLQELERLEKMLPLRGDTRSRRQRSQEHPRART